MSAGRIRRKSESKVCYLKRGSIKELTHTKDKNSTWGHHFGLMEKSRDYYIYAYLDEKKVFTSTFQNVLSVLLAYLLIVAVVDMMLWGIGRNECAFGKTI